MRIVFTLKYLQILCKKQVLALCLLTLCWAPPIKSAEMMDLPIKLQFKLLLKAATYNRAQAAKDPKTLRIGLIHAPVADSKKIVQDIVALFGEQAVTVRKYFVEMSPLVFQNSAQLKKATESQNVNIYYVAPGNEKNLKSILETSRQLKILTTTGVSDYVYEGVTLGVTNNGSRPAFLYNKNTAQADGTDFHSNFLRMVKVVNK